jgi:hypothetical protein
MKRTNVNEHTRSPRGCNVPSVSPKQKRFMQAAAHNAEFAAKAGISQSVARDFYRADQRKARRSSIKRAMDKVRK